MLAVSQSVEAILPSKTALHAVPSTVDRFDDEVEKFSQIARDLIRSLPTGSEEDVLRARITSKKLGIYSWVVEVACDAEIWNRAKFKSGPGKSDTEGVGIMAAVAKRAKELSSTYKTLKINARIHNTFNERLNLTVQTLPDKQFYVVALKSDDPNKAIDTFIEEKEKNPKFNPASAGRKLTQDKRVTTAIKAEIVETYTEPEEKTLSEHIREFLSTVRTFKANCPSKDFARRMYDPIIEDFQEHLEGEMADNASCKAVIGAWSSTCCTEEQIVNRTKLSAKDVAHVFVLLSAAGLFVKANQDDKIVWWKVGVAPIKDI